MGEESNKRPEKDHGKILWIITTIIALVCCGFMCVKYKQLDSKVSAQIYSQSDVDTMVAKQSKQTKEEMKKTLQKNLSDGESPLSVLRKMYPEDVVYNTSGKYEFVPIIKDIPGNTLNNDNFVKNEKGELEYKENDKVISHKGIDVSKYQGTIDWNQVATDGVEFAFLRIGYRGYGTGAIQLDESFKDNYEGATKAGIKVGVYFFSQAIDKKEAKEEARFVIDNLKEYKVKCPVVFDTEEVASGEGRMKDISSKKLTDITIEFLETVKDKGYTPMVYANIKWFVSNLDMSRLADYEKWFAAYTSPLYFPYEISMWQYSDAGKVAGIQGNVDINISFKEWKS